MNFTMRNCNSNLSDQNQYHLIIIIVLYYITLYYIVSYHSFIVLLNCLVVANFISPAHHPSTIILFIWILFFNWNFILFLLFNLTFIYLCLFYCHCAVQEGFSWWCHVDNDNMMTMTTWCRCWWWQWQRDSDTILFYVE